MYITLRGVFMPFLPITAKEAQDRGWDYVDFVIVTGDSYVDHPFSRIATPNINI